MILGIFGAGGLGREVLVLATQINEAKDRWGRIIFIDDKLVDENIENTEIYTFNNFSHQFACEEAEVCIALGEPVFREKLALAVVEKGFSLATLVHPSVYVPNSTQIGAGAIVCVGSFISCNVIIGENVLIQPHVNVGHDCIIREHTVLSGFVNLAGGCTIQERTYIALSVCVKENTIIGSDSVVGMGSVVARDIPDNVIAIGNPARPMKKNEELRVFK